MKVLGLRNLTKFDLIEILFNLDTVSVHGNLDGEFCKEDEKAHPLLDLATVKSLIDLFGKNTVSEISSRKVATASFSRSFLFFLLISLLRERTAFRRTTCEFLISLLNNRLTINSLASQPFSFLLVFYGEGEVASKLTNLGSIPRLTKQEADIISSFVEQSYNYALISMFLGRSKTLCSFNEVSFGFFCEANSINSEFLNVLADKKAYHRHISNTSENVINMVINSNFKKAPPSEALSTLVELIGLVKSEVGTLWQVLVDEMVFEDEGAANKKTRNEGRKNFSSINVIVKGVLGRLSILVDNISERSLKQFFNAEGKLSVLRASVVEILRENEILSEKVGEAGQAFGSGFYSSLKLEVLCNLWERAVKHEAFLSLEGLEALYFKINPKKKEEAPSKEEKKPADEGKKPAEAEGKKPPQASSAPKKLQLGKGSLQLFTQYLTDFAENKPEEAAELTFKRFSETYFDVSNKAFVESVETLFSSKNEERRRPKIPKGTRDFTAFQMSIRRKVFQTITNIFARHGAVEIDTPVFELKETLTGKYGEDSKLIYDLDDQGGELLALRYDLTVPFARYVAMKNITNIKRYHIAKVYRRDNPVMSKGRFREFYQCDLDIAGNYDTMIPDAEVLKVIDEILSELEIGQFKIKVNNRKILDAMIEISKAPKQKFNQICSSIDKLDKEEWTEVRRELIEDKGLSKEMADCLGRFVVIKGDPRTVLAQLKQNNVFQDSKTGLAALEEMGLLFDYLEAMGGLKNVMFDLSLARGLDYYTGMICETVLEGAQVGSISGGGRYDGLVGMFTNKQIPSVGASIGIERIFGILEEKAKNDASIRQNQTEVFIATVGPDMVGHKLKIASELWQNDIKAEFLYNVKPKPQKQIDYVHEHLIPFMLWIGEDELKADQVKLKYTPTHGEEFIKRENLLPTLKAKLSQYYKDLSEGKVHFEKKEAAGEEAMVEEGAEKDKRGAGKKEEKKPRGGGRKEKEQK